MQIVPETQDKPLIVALSGGIDSVVLLHWLLASHRSPLIVAHVNHGLRSDSHQDEQLVRGLAMKHNLPFHSVRLNLPAGSSEQTARDARYQWLDTVARQHGGVVTTGHHQDDVLETILLNLTRGSGWRGIASLRSHDSRHRPLLTWPKADVVQYALKHGLYWREDSTNDDLRFRRNYLRHGIAGRLHATQRQRLVDLYESQLKLRHGIDAETSRLISDIKTDQQSLPRYQLIMLPEDVALEVLRSVMPVSLTRPQLKRLLWQVKTARPGTQHSLGEGHVVTLTRGQLIV